jgi:hypothetical protein
MPAYKDHSGEKINGWTFLSRIPNKRPPKYICQCDCGYLCENFISNIASGKSKNCLKCAALKNAKEFIGKKFHKLTIMDIFSKNGYSYAIVECDCGNKRNLKLSQIQKKNEPQITGKYVSCGKCKNRTKYFKIGFKKGKLKVVKEINSHSALALCECGNEKIVKIHHFLNQIPSCGCLFKERNIEKAKKLEGTTYFYLKVLKFLRMGEDKRSIYLVKCKCGKKFEEGISHLFQAKSCGCLQKQNVARGSKNSFAKLSEAEVGSMRDLFSTGLYSRNELAEIYEISYGNTCSIIKCTSWKHV